VSTWYSIYVTATGELKGHTSIPVASPDPAWTVVEHDGRQDQTHRWNPATKAWDRPIPVPVMVDRLQDLADHPYAAEIWSRLTVAQRLKLRRTLAWLLGNRRYRQQNEEVAIDVAPEWPIDPGAVNP